MSRAALTAYESADYARAGDLYVQAYKTDPKPEFLFGAARSAHLGGDLDRADELYKTLMTLPGVEPVLVNKARGYVADVRIARADRKAREAKAVEARGDKALAARLWLDAVALNPARVDWLIQLGRAQADAGDRQAAIATYRRYLKDAPAADADRAEAQARLAALEPAEKAPAAAAMSTAAPAVVVERHVDAPEAAGPGTRKIAGWSALGAGGALGFTGLVVYLLAKSDDSALQTALAQRDVAGHISGVTLSDARTRQNSIDTRETTAAVLAGVAVAAVGVGTWLWLGDSQTVVVTPTLNGASLAMRW